MCLSWRNEDRSAGKTKGVFKYSKACFVEDGRSLRGCSRGPDPKSWIQTARKERSGWNFRNRWVGGWESLKMRKFSIGAYVSEGGWPFFVGDLWGLWAALGDPYAVDFLLGESAETWALSGSHPALQPYDSMAQILLHKLHPLTGTASLPPADCWQLKESLLRFWNLTNFALVWWAVPVPCEPRNWRGNCNYWQFPPPSDTNSLHNQIVVG